VYVPPYARTESSRTVSLHLKIGDKEPCNTATFRVMIARRKQEPIENENCINCMPPYFHNGMTDIKGATRTRYLAYRTPQRRILSKSGKAETDQSHSLWLATGNLNRPSLVTFFLAFLGTQITRHVKAVKVETEKYRMIDFEKRRKFEAHWLEARLSGLGKRGGISSRRRSSCDKNHSILSHP
jgi:hypothetical protein